MAEEQKTTGERPVSRTRHEVVREAKRIEESLLYSSKGHLAASHFWGNFHLWIGIPMVVMSTVAGASALSQLDPNHLIAGILSTIVAALAAVITFLNPNEKESAHLKAGNTYDTLLSEVRIFRTIGCWGDESDEVLTERLKNLSDRKSHLNQTCPQIPRWAYQRAKKGIIAGEAEYQADQDDPPPAQSAA